jgi:alpha/beta superfamily hydrolase
MRSEETVLTAHGREYPAELSLPDDDTDHGAVLLPGANHGPYGDVFDHFAAALTDAGVALLRFETWGDREELDDIEEKSGEEFDAEYAAAVDLLAARYDRVDVVAKSFGGTLALDHHPDGFERLVLWAPAPLLAEGEVVEQVDAPDDVSLPTVASSTLADLDRPVDILQGDEDDIPVDNARELAGPIPDASVHVVEGADHSFVGGDPEDETVETTVALLTDGQV